MKTWQERGKPYEGYEYSGETPNYFWDGRQHYWPGMAVRGSEDQNHDNPACCQNLAVYDRTGVSPPPPHLERMRSGLKKRGLTHRAAGERMGLCEAGVRSRLYGKAEFTRGDFLVMCRLAGVAPEGLDRTGLEDEE